MSERTGRTWITEALTALPAKTRNKNLVGNLGRFADMAEQARDTLTSSLRGATRMKLVFADAATGNVVEKLVNAQKKARTCVRDLTQSLDVVAKSSFETRVIDIRDHATGSIRPLLESWQRRIDDAIRPYEKLAQVVQDRHLDGGDELVAALGRIKEARTQTPATKEEALGLKVLIDGLPSVVRSLGLTGGVGAFLVAVAEGTGSPRDLERVEVREFLDRYALWDDLRVSFGSSR
jgi:hypothetical protein